MKKREDGEKSDSHHFLRVSQKDREREKYGNMRTERTVRTTNDEYWTNTLNTNFQTRFLKP